MKILVLSDFYWNAAAKQITEQDFFVFKETGVVLERTRFKNLRYYCDIVEKEKPDVVLLAGDLTGDGSCGHGFQNAFMYFCLYLEYMEIPSLMVQGDNDVDEFYEQVVPLIADLKYVQECSGEIVKIGGLNILGLSFLQTNRKFVLKELVEKHKEQNIDILFTHAPLKRRTKLFDFNAKNIITGHFDNKLLALDGTCLISLSNDSDLISYCTIRVEAEDTTYRYCLHNSQQRFTACLSDTFSGLCGAPNAILQMDNKPWLHIRKFEDIEAPHDWERQNNNHITMKLKYLRGQQYKEALRRIRSPRQKKMDNPYDILGQKINPFSRVSKTMITDYN